MSKDKPSLYAALEVASAAVAKVRLCRQCDEKLSNWQAASLTASYTHTHPTTIHLSKAGTHLRHQSSMRDLPVIVWQTKGQVRKSRSLVKCWSLGLVRAGPRPSGTRGGMPNVTCCNHPTCNLLVDSSTSWTQKGRGELSKKVWRKGEG